MDRDGERPQPTDKAERHKKDQPLPAGRVLEPAPPRFDIVGVGLNAADTFLILPRFPSHGGKEQYVDEIMGPGGQVASAMVACARWGLRVSYVGTIGDDEAGRIQRRSLEDAGVDLEYLRVRNGCASQTAYVLVDSSTGERTILWRRPDCLCIDPDEVPEERIVSARLLHVDGHDTPAVARAAALARAAGVPVSVDVDTIYDGFDQVLPNVDYLVASEGFPAKWTGESDPFRALETIQERYGMNVAAMTLGAYGALARSEGRYYYSPGFAVDCVDTTGAGDIFHGAFCYSVVEGKPLAEALEFSGAMAALNCRALGARGGIATQQEAMKLIARGERRCRAEFLRRAQTR